MSATTGPMGSKVMPTSVPQTVPLREDALPIAREGRPVTVFDLLPAMVSQTPGWYFRQQVGRTFNAGIVGLALLASAGTLLTLFTRGEERVGAFLERVASRIAFIDGVALRRSFEHPVPSTRPLPLLYSLRQHTITSIRIAI